MTLIRSRAVIDTHLPIRIHTNIIMSYVNKMCIALQSVD